MSYILYSVREGVILQIIEKWLLPLLVFIIVPGAAILAILAYVAARIVEMITHRSNDHDK
jgi:hypothetical protein